jgi:epoxyqueuosine reductase
MSRPPLLPLGRVERLAKALGFAAVGVCPATPMERFESLRSWIAAGRHGEMAYLARHLEAQRDPSSVLPGVRSVIVVADRYHDGRPDRLDAGAPAKGRIARYARGRDYHREIRERLDRLAAELRELAPEAAFRACVDTAPLPERELAARAGIGRIGKHTLLIGSPREGGGLGSWLLLGEILATAEIEPSPRSAAVDPCGSCTRCIDACPTKAITPFSVDATRCISYLTIEHRGGIDPSLHEAIGDWIFGCDVCQEVCPHNAPTRRSRRGGTHAAYASRRDGFDLLEVLSWDEDARRDAFVTSALKRAKLDMMKRNALIAAGNALHARSDAALLERIREIAADPAEPAMVRETAQEVLGRLGSEGRDGRDG